MPKLYEITNQYQKALTELSELELDEDTIKDTLEGLKGDLEAKGKAVGAYIANCEADIGATKEAAKKLSERAKSEQAKIDKLKDYLLYNMELNGITEIRSPDLLIKLRKLPPSVKIIEEESIPIDFLSYKTVTSIDKKAIKQVIQSGDKVKGAELSIDKYKVVIS